MKNTRLSILLDALNITGRELAKAIYVDYSLVSKWKSGDRVLTSRSVHLQKIGEYFISIDKLMGNNTIIYILREFFEESELHGKAKLTNALCKYLTCLDSVISSTQTNTLTKNSFNIENKVYSGNKGRRIAVIDFLDYVLSSQSEKQLLLVSQEDMSWLTEDEDFLSIWEQKLKQILSQGHKIKIIHWVDRQPKSLAAIYSKWLPMHLTGGLESWFYPFYVELKHKNTIFIVKNEIAIFGSTINNNKETRYTLFFYDQISVLHYERLYESIFSDCIKLFNSYSKSEADRFWNRVSEEGAKKDNAYLFSDVPFFITMPPEILIPVLEDNNIDENTILKCLSFSSNIHSASENHHTKCVFSIDKIQELMCKDSFLCAELSNFIGTDIYIKKEHFKMQLSYLAYKIKLSENYEICLLSDAVKSKFLNANIWIKQNAILLAWTNSPNPNAVSVNEPTLVTAACQFFHSIWERIPRVNREKNDVINTILNLIK